MFRYLMAIMSSLFQVLFALSIFTTSCMFSIVSAQEDPIFANGFETFTNRIIFAGETINLDLSVIDPGGFPESITYSVSPLPLPSNAILNNDSFTFKPGTEQTGSFEFIFTAINSEGISRTGSITISVLSPPVDGTTSLSGRLLDSIAMNQGQQVPIAGATISDFNGNSSTLSDNDGFFTLSGISGSLLILDIDSTTADPAPDGSTYSSFREPFPFVSNINNIVNRPIFLTRIDPDSVTPINPNGTTTVENPNIDVSVVVPPSTAEDEEGNSFTGDLSISLVPNQLLPAQLPRELQPGMVVTIQPTGTRFNTPVSVTFPNIDNLPIGTIVDIWSVDPQTGEFGIVGKGRVSDDRNIIETIEGGIVAATWHFPLPQAITATSELPENNESIAQSSQEAICRIGSTAGIRNGCLNISHSIPSYRSSDTEHSLTLSYHSQQAAPVPIINLGTSLTNESVIPNVISVDLINVGGVNQSFQAYSEAQSGELRHAVSFDASNFPTGRYNYEVMVDSIFSSSTVGTRITGSTIVDNQINSSVGAGWNINATSTIISNSKQPLLRTESGEIIQFQPSTTPNDFFPNFTFSAGDGPEDIITIDVNGDNIPDLITANINSDDVSVFLGDGRGGFASERRFPAGNSAQSVVSADLNNDSIPDLATANIFDNSISILIGNGSGDFQEIVQLSVGDRPESITAVDLNNDNFIDLVTANNSSDDVSILINNGNGSFQEEQRVNVPNDPTFVSAGDLENNGTIDLVVVHNLDDSISILPGNGDGTFQERSSLFLPRSAFSNTIKVTDLNNDGALDIATSGGGVHTFLGNGDGTFNERISYNTALGDRSLTIEDFNNDGILDIVTANTSSFNNDISLLFGNGDGTFQSQQRLPVGNSLQSITAIDLNQDGVLDIAATHTSVRDSISILIGLGDGNFFTQEKIRTGSAPQSTTINDFNSDGHQDIAVSNSSSDDISVFLGNGDGEFPLQHTFPSGNSPQSILSGDIDNDGRLDLITINQFGEEISILLGNGGGTFSTPILIDIGNVGEPTELQVVDINQDNILDIALTSNTSGSSNPDFISVLIGNGNAGFTIDNIELSGSGANSLSLSDIDSDGFIDAIVANRFSDDIEVLLGDGNGNFQFTGEINIDNPSQIITSDLNSDEQLDIVVASGFSNGLNLSVLIGTGNGSFSPPDRYSAGSIPVSVIAKDINNDGIIDLATANSSGGDVSLLLGNGDGTFLDHIRFSAGERPSSINSTDINSDGLPDLVVTNRDIVDNTISIFLNSLSTDNISIGPPGEYSFITSQEDGSFIRSFPDGSTHVFSPNGLQTKAQLNNGTSYTYTYDNSDRLQQIIDPVGLVTHLRYSNNLLNEIEDPAGRITRLVHDEHNNLRQIINPDGSQRSFNYNDTHLLLSQQDSNDNTTNYTYDRTNRVISSVLSDGTIRKTASSTTAALIQFHEETDINEPAPSIMAEQINSAYIDGNNNLYTYITDSFGAIVQSTDSILRTTKADRNPDGKITRLIRSNGSIQKRKYDRNGNILELVEDTNNAKTIYRYNSNFDQITLIEDPLGNRLSIEYDDSAKPIRIIDALGVITTFLYEDTNCTTQPTSVSQATGLTEEVTTSFTYDSSTCNLTSQTDSLGRVSTQKHDLAGNIVETTDHENKVSRFEYDSMNRIKKTIDPSNSSQNPECASIGITCFNYDPAGNIINIVSDNGAVNRYRYNNRNQIIETTDPLGNSSFNYYDAEGNVVRTVDRNEQEIIYQYDSANRLVVKVWQPNTPAEETIEYTYDELDNIIFGENGSSSINREFDPIGRLTSVSTDNSINQPRTEIRYAYDKNNNRISLISDSLRSNLLGTNDSASINYTYDALNQLTSISFNNEDSILFQYDALNRRNTTTRPNGVTTKLSFDNANQIRSLLHEIETTGEVLLQNTYEYNNIGARTTLNQNRSTVVNTEEQSFSYDEIGQLTSSTAATVDQIDETFFYDTSGNRLRNQTQSFESIYNIANQLLEDEYACYKYDLNGNLIEKRLKSSSLCIGNSTNYTYDTENQLTSISLGNAELMRFKYDVFGRRIKIASPSSTKVYVYDGEDILLEYDDTLTLRAQFVHGTSTDEPIFMERDVNNNGTFIRLYYLSDTLGSITDLVDVLGDIVQSYSYDSFGNTTIHNSAGTKILPPESIENPYAYTSREFDSQTNLYYYRSRYYSPSIGRFFQQDPIGFVGGNTNLYSYVLNNPINANDPSGLFIHFAIGAAFNVAVELGNVALSENISFTEGASRVVIAAASGALGVGVASRVTGALRPLGRFIRAPIGNVAGGLSSDLINSTAALAISNQCTNVNDIGRSVIANAAFSGFGQILRVPLVRGLRASGFAHSRSQALLTQAGIFGNGIQTFSLIGIAEANSN